MCPKLCLALLITFFTSFFAILLVELVAEYSTGHQTSVEFGSGSEFGPESGLLNTTTTTTPTPNSSLSLRDPHAPIDNKPYLALSIDRTVNELCNAHWSDTNNIASIKSWNHDPRLAEKIPYECTSDFQSWGLPRPIPASDFDVYEVRYDDCRQAFLFCWHKAVGKYFELAARVTFVSYLIHS